VAYYLLYSSLALLNVWLSWKIDYRVLAVYFGV